MKNIDFTDFFNVFLSGATIPESPFLYGFPGIRTPFFHISIFSDDTSFYATRRLHALNRKVRYIRIRFFYKMESYDPCM